MAHTHTHTHTHTHAHTYGAFTEQGEQLVAVLGHVILNTFVAYTHTHTHTSIISSRTCVRQASFVWATWLIHTCRDTGYLFVWHDSFIWDMTQSHVRHDLFIWDMTQSYVRHESFICDTWLIHMGHDSRCSNISLYIWVATVCRIDKIIGLFCKRDL